MASMKFLTSDGPLRQASYAIFTLLFFYTMSRKLFSYLYSYWSSPLIDQPRDAVRALPSNWYSSPEMYELERRAIFSRKWQLITHKVRLQNAGDWLRYDIAGFDIILCCDRQGNINGFHNVCRHRAYPVVTGDKGTSSIFSCKYHGWSYGLNGNLAKAPGYQELVDFDRSRNSLFPVHVHIDCNGFIWINLDAGKKPEISWEDDFDGIDQQERYSLYDFNDYVFDHMWQMEGAYNWKILADNYNECYHCATTHPDLPAVANLEAYSVITEGTKIIHDPGTTEEQAKAGLSIAATYFFPNVSTNVSLVDSLFTLSKLQLTQFRDHIFSWYSALYPLVHLHQ
jgi:phenylpropionate dioxygenase-like ring-hydroxylating dioxygenase large terminal subunit